MFPGEFYSSSSQAQLYKFPEQFLSILNLMQDHEWNNTEKAKNGVLLKFLNQILKFLAACNDYIEIEELLYWLSSIGGCCESITKTSRWKLQTLGQLDANYK